MRIDKFLWCVRFYKTRSLASQACKKGAIKVNNDHVKPSREVFVGDTLLIRKNPVIHQIEILEMPANRMAAKKLGLFIKDHTPKEAFEKLALVKQASDYYRAKGTGRPTKKDRRDIDNFIDNE